MEVATRLLYLLSIPRVGPGVLNRVRARYASFHAMTNDLWSGRTVEEEAEDALTSRLRTHVSTGDLTSARSWVDESIDHGHHIVTADDPIYPRNLAGVTTAPPILFVRGTLDRLSQRALALVGSVEPSDRGIARARRFAALCSEHHIQVISGLARGIDGVSHRMSVELGTPTFAVLGHGLRYLFPPEHRSLADEIVAAGGALLSQFAPGVQPSRWTFPMRNELMCTIAKGTVIIEIERDQKFGTVIQANFSRKHGRPVFILQSNLSELKSKEAQALVDEDIAFPVRAFEDVLSRIEQSQLSFTSPLPDLFAPTTEALDAEKEVRDLRAILFDLDGVLHDAKPIMLHAYVKALGDVGKIVSESEIQPLLNKSPYVIWRQFGVDPRRASTAYSQRYVERVNEVPCAFDRACDFVKVAKSRGFKVGVVTSQPRRRAEAVLARCGLSGALDVTIVWDDVPRGKTKPDPAGINLALERLGVAAQSSFYVGDAPSDIEAARRAGVRGVAVGWGLYDAEDLAHYSPDVFLATPHELDALLE